MDFGTLGAGKLGFHPSTWALPIRFWTGPSSARKVNALHRCWRQLHSPIKKKDFWILLVWDLTIRTLVCSNPKWGDITSKHERNTFHDEFPRAFPIENCDRSTPKARSIPCLVIFGLLAPLPLASHQRPRWRTDYGYHWDGKNLVFTDYGYHSLGQKQSKNHRDNIYIYIIIYIYKYWANLLLVKVKVNRSPSQVEMKKHEKTTFRTIPQIDRIAWAPLSILCDLPHFPFGSPEKRICQSAPGAREMCSWLTANPEISVLSQLDWESM